MGDINKSHSQEAQSNHCAKFQLLCKTFSLRCMQKIYFTIAQKKIVYCPDFGIWVKSLQGVRSPIEFFLCKVGDMNNYRDTQKNDPDTQALTQKKNSTGR